MSQDIPTRHIGQPDIQDDHVERIFLDLSQRLAAILRGLDPVIATIENAHAAFDDDFLIVDDQNSRAH